MHGTGDGSWALAGGGRGGDEAPGVEEVDDPLVGADHDAGVGHLAHVVRPHAPVKATPALLPRHRT